MREITMDDKTKGGCYRSQSITGNNTLLAWQSVIPQRRQSIQQHMYVCKYVTAPFALLLRRTDVLACLILFAFCFLTDKFQGKLK